jgi:putative ATPase
VQSRCVQLHAQPSTSPVCSNQVPELNINQHLDKECSSSNVSSSSTAKKPKIQLPMASIFNLSSKRPELSSTPRTPMKRGPTNTQTPFEERPIKRSKISSHLHAVAPLAEKLRPNTLSEFIGQSHLTGPDSLLMNILEAGSTGSMILWGPPGYKRAKRFFNLLLTWVTDAEKRHLHDYWPSALKLCSESSALLSSE